MHTQETIYEDEFHRVTFKPVEGYMIYVSNGVPPSSEHLRNGLRKILEISKSNHLSTQAFLADLRKADTPPIHDTIWLNEVFLPQILNVGVRKMAWVVPSRILPKIALDYMVNKVVPPSCEFCFFDNPEDAHTWLNENDM